MAWRRQSCPLPDVGISSGRSLASGCCLSGDCGASWIVLWQGSALAWFHLRPGLQDQVADSWQFSFEGRGAVVSAQALPLANAVVVVLSSQVVTVIHWQATGAEEFALSAEAYGIAAWPIGGSSFVIISSLGQMKYVDLETSLAPAPLGQDMSLNFDEVSATSSHQNSVPGEALVAIAGRSRGRRMLCIWRLRGSSIINLSELQLPIEGAAESNAGSVDPVDIGPMVIELAIRSALLCTLLADGSLILASCNEDASSWAVHTQMSAWRIAGLRLCSVAGVDEMVLDEAQDSNAVPATVAHFVHLSDSELSLVFLGGPDDVSGVAEIVTLKAPELRLAEAEPHRVLCACPASEAGESAGVQLVGSGIAGSKLVCVTAQPNGNAAGSIEILERSAGCNQVGRGRVDHATSATVQQFHALLSIADLEEFVTHALEFNAFADSKQGDKATVFFACEQVQRLLEIAQVRLHVVLGEALPAEAQPVAETGGDGWDDGGWDVDDLTFEEEGGATQKPADAASAQGSPLSEAETARFQQLLSRVKLQLGRLRIFRCVQDETLTGSARTLSWSNFREMDATALRRLSRQMAAGQCIPFLEALFEQHWETLMHQWDSILDALPETVPVQLVRRILPALPCIKGVSWYIRRSQHIVQRTGLCHLALELLWHGIHVLITGQWPQDFQRATAEAAVCTAASLPTVSEATAGSRFEVEALCGMFRLCMEYAAYTKVALRELYRRQPTLFHRGGRASNDGLLAEIMSFSDFCALEARQRAQLVLRHSTTETIAQDASEWALQVSVEHCLSASAASSLIPRTQAEDALLKEDSPIAALVSQAISACTEPVEEALVEALIGCLGGCGWEPSSLQMMAQVVVASRPDRDPNERLIRSNLRLLEFILGTVYSDDQRCRALDIVESVDLMYGCIPNKDAHVPQEGATRWAELMHQADELERHLNCVVELQKCEIYLSSSFADLRRGCTNEPMALHSLWNLFRVLGARFRKAAFWSEFKDILMYLHENAFAAVDRSSVYAMFVRCIVDQEHFTILSEVTQDWANSCGPIAVAGALASLAQELVNSSPALRHPSLEKATRVLKCIPQVDGELQGVARSELDFIKACGLLHDLVHLQPKGMLQNLQNLRNINPISSLSQVTTKVTQVSAQMTSKRPPQTSESPIDRKTSSATRQGSNSAVGFRIDGPLQLRLLLDQPLRVVTDLLQYNPAVLAEVEDLHTFCKLLGLLPSTPAWAEVMAMCGAANLVSGNRAEALSVTEKLLANAHPAAWKLALALAASSEDDVGSACGKSLDFDECSDLLADATKVCPSEELHLLLSSFNQGCPLLTADSSFDASTLTQGSASGSPAKARSRRTRGYAYDVGQKTSLSVWARSEFGLNLANPFGGDKVSASKLPGMWRGLHLWRGAGEKLSDVSACQSWGEALLAVDRDAGTALLDATLVNSRCTTSLASTTRSSDGARAADRPPGTSVAARISQEAQIKVDAGASFKRKPETRLPSSVSAAPAFPIDFDEALAGAAEDSAGRSQIDWPPDSSPESQPPPIAHEPQAPYAEHEKEVYKSMLPSLQSSGATWESATRALQEATADVADSPSARVLLWRRVMDMCEEVMQAQGQDECPESATEPVTGVLTSVLSSMHQACPELDLACQGSTLADEVLRCASKGTDVAQRLMRAIAGVEALQEAGVSPSSVALEAAKRAVCGKVSPCKGSTNSSCTLDIAVLVPWLKPCDVLELLSAVMNDSSIPRIRQMEVLGHVRSFCEAHTEMLPGDQQRLQRAIRQAEVLSLLRSVFEAHYGDMSSNVDFPLRLDITASLSTVRAEWARKLKASSDADEIFPCVEPILQGLEMES